MNTITVARAYYINIVTNHGMYYWNDYANAFVKHESNRTEYDSWEECDRRCEELNAEYNGAAYFHRKLVAA